MDTPAIRAAINERLADHMIPAVLDRLAMNHRKRDWRTCSCSFCQLKRQATASIANARRVRGFLVDEYDPRPGVRARYRKLMDAEFNI